MKKNSHARSSERGVNGTPRERELVAAVAYAEGVSAFLGRSLVSHASYYKFVAGGRVLPIIKRALLDAAHHPSAVESACAERDVTAA